MHLQHPIYFDAPGAEGGTPAAGNDANPGNGSSPATTPADGSGGDQRTFTQAELDAILQKRLGRAGETAVSQLLETVGAKDAEALKAQLAELQQIKQGQMTELEQAQAKIKELEGSSQQAAQLKAQIEALEAAVTAQLEAVKKSLTIPAFVSKLLEGMEPAAQLAYLAEHGDAMQRPAAGDTNASNRGTPTPKDPKARKEELKGKFRALH